MEVLFGEHHNYYMTLTSCMRTMHNRKQFCTDLMTVLTRFSQQPIGKMERQESCNLPIFKNFEWEPWTTAEVQDLCKFSNFKWEAHQYRDGTHIFFKKYDFYDDFAKNYIILWRLSKFYDFFMTFSPHTRPFLEEKLKMCSLVFGWRPFFRKKWKCGPPHF